MYVYQRVMDNLWRLKDLQTSIDRWLKSGGKELFGSSYGDPSQLETSIYKGFSMDFNGIDGPFIDVLPNIFLGEL